MAEQLAQPFVIVDEATIDAAVASLRCPFTGSPVEVRRTSDGAGWFGIVSSPRGGYVTTLFGRRSQVVDFFSMVGGTLGKPLTPKITIRDAPLIPDVEAEERQTERDLDDVSKTAASRTVRRARNAGVVQPG